MLALVGTADGLDYLGDGRHDFDGHEVTAVAIDGSIHWAILDGRTVCCSEDGGDWREVVAIDSGRANCLGPSPAGLLVGASGARLFQLTGDRLVPVDSFAGAPGRARWYTPSGGPPDVRSLAVEDGRVFVNIHVGGIVRSDGASWQSTIDINTDIHQVIASDGWLFAACARGLAWSADGGDNWQVSSDGLQHRYCRAVALAVETILISASDGPAGPRGAIYRTPIANPSRFERCRDGLPEWFGRNIDTGCLDAKDSRALFGTEDGDLFFSDDEGSHWQQVGGGLPAVRAIAFA
ncbi:MAG: hypothetical protein U0556_04335 [Dehalococcoidia bacterium]